MTLHIDDVVHIDSHTVEVSIVELETCTLVYKARGVDMASAMKAARRIIDNQSKVGTLINRCADLEAALRPFAAYGASLDQRLPDTALVTSGLRSPTAQLSVGECRSAATVLANGRASK